MAAILRQGRKLLHCLLIGTLFGAAQFCAFATGSVTLAWIPSADPSVVGYNLYYGGASGVYTNTIQAANSTNAIVSGLVDGATYYFAATAYDSTGLESPFSNEASYVVPLTVANNNPPTLDTLGNLTLNANAGLQTVSLSGITPGAATESQTLTVSAASSNPALIPNPAVSYASANATGSLTFTPASNASGTATITVTVNDGQALNNTVTQTFTVTVNAVNPAPSLNPISDFYLTKNAAVQTVTLTGISPGMAIISSSTAQTKQTSKQTIKVTAVSGNTKLLSQPTIRYSSPASAGILSFKPVKNATGTTTITVTVNNGAKTNNITKKTFKVTILATGVATPAKLTPAAHVSGQFALNVTGASGAKYIVQASTNMVNWAPVQTNTAPFTFTDTKAGQFSQRFYRTVSAP